MMTVPITENETTAGNTLGGCSLSVLAPGDESSFEQIRPAWEAMLSGRSNPYLLYQSPLWWDHMISTGGADSTAIVTFQRSESVSGIVPVRTVVRRLDFPGLPFLNPGYPLRALEILGSEPLVSQEEGVYPRLLSFLGETFPSVDAIFLKCLLEDGDFWSYLRTLDSDEWIAYWERDFERLHGIELPESFEAYNRRFSHKKRYNLNRQVRLLREHCSGNMKLLRVESPQQVDDFVRDARAVSGRSWQFKRNVPQNIDAETKARELADLSRRGILRSYLLMCGDQPGAYVIGYQYRGVYHYSDVAYDEDLARFSPGSVLLYRLIEDLIEHHRPGHVNLGVGDADYKSQFANQQANYISLLLLRKSPVNRMLMIAHRTYRRIGIRLKSILRGRR
jgi:CelD/BcsL family acetyltransferase involved in cellulose biosynthesis